MPQDNLYGAYDQSLEGPERLQFGGIQYMPAHGLMEAPKMIDGRAPQHDPSSNIGALGMNPLGTGGAGPSANIWDQLFPHSSGMTAGHPTVSSPMTATMNTLSAGGGAAANPWAALKPGAPVGTSVTNPMPGGGTFRSTQAVGGHENSITSKYGWGSAFVPGA
jgi:hypothetical protein